MAYRAMSLQTNQLNMFPMSPKPRSSSFHNINVSLVCHMTLKPQLSLEFDGNYLEPNAYEIVSNSLNTEKSKLSTSISNIQLDQPDPLVSSTANEDKQEEPEQQLAVDEKDDCDKEEEEQPQSAESPESQNKIESELCQCEPSTVSDENK